MKTILLFTLLSIFVMVSGVSAQDETDFSSSRLTNLTAQLKRQTVDIADRAQETISRGFSASRSDIEAAFLATQLDASAGLFQQMVRDNRRASELRDAATFLSDISRRAPNFGSGNWRDAQRSIDDINRELGSLGNGSGNGSGNGNGNGNQQILGRVSWRGTVDNEVHLAIRNNTLDTRIFAGQSYGPGTFNFSQPLPNRNVQMYVNKKKGRGSATVIQQPDRFNDFTALIKILDSSGGAKEYEVEIYWTN
jgi:hypothetical protein